MCGAQLIPPKPDCFHNKVHWKDTQQAATEKMKKKDYVDFEENAINFENYAFIISNDWSICEEWEFA